MNKLNKEDKEFVKRVAHDSVNGTLEVDEIRKAFKLIMGIDPEGLSPNIRIMRNELYRFNEKAEVEELPLPDALNPDFDINQVLPTEVVEVKTEPVVLPKAEEQQVVDRRTKEFRNFVKNTKK